MLSIISPLIEYGNLVTTIPLYLSVTLELVFALVGNSVELSTSGVVFSFISGVVLSFVSVVVFSFVSGMVISVVSHPTNADNNREKINRIANNFVLLILTSGEI